MYHGQVVPGFPKHPHRGFETVTIVYDGEVEHRDSAGGGGLIGPGDVQWMTAASGIVHSEFHGPALARNGGRFEVILRKDMRLSFPRAETPTHFITMATDPDLDEAAKAALRDMIVLITQRTPLSREDAYTLCSLAADLRVTQLVDVYKGIHVMLPKSALAAEASA